MMLAWQLVSLALAADVVRLTGAYWIDASGDASVEVALAEAAAGAFTPFATMLSAGYTGKPVWIRLDVPAGNPRGEDWVLRLRPAWHDEFELFDPAFASQVPRLTGDRYPWSGDEYRSLNLNFRIAQTEAPRALMLRLKSSHSLIVGAELVPLSLAGNLDQRQFAWFMAYLAFLVFVLVSTLSAWLSDRDPLFAVVSLAMAAGILYASSMFGLLRVLLDGVVASQLLNRLNGVLIIVYPLTTVLFYRAFLQGYGLQRWSRVGLDLVVTVGLVCLLLVVAGAADTAFLLNNANLVVGVVWLLIALWFGLKVPNEARHGVMGVVGVRLVVSGVLFITFMGLVRTLGVVGNQATTIEAFLTHVFVVSLLLSLVLQLRTRQRRLDLIRAEQRALHEVRLRENLQRFMDMFSHEVRTPLAIVSLAVEQGVRDPVLAGQARSAIEDLDRLVTRSLQVDALEADATKLVLHEVDLERLVSESAERLGVGDALVWAERGAGLVKVDPYLAQVVVSNLLENAVKYGVRGTPITVAARRRSADSVALTVNNRIDARGVFDGARAFEKYYRSPQAARSSGAGLGLYLSKALAELQGGGLRLLDQSDRAVTFELWVQA